MNSLTKHIPNWAEGGCPAPWEFETTEELLELPFVKEWEKGFDGRKFSHFSKSDESLMAIYDDGKFWWVVGHIKNPSDVNLPEWKSPK